MTNSLGWGHQAENEYAELIARLETAKAYREQDAYEASWDDAEVAELRSLAPVTDLSSDRAAEFAAERRDAIHEELAMERWS